MRFTILFSGLTYLKYNYDVTQAANIFTAVLLIVLIMDIAELFIKWHKGEK